MIRAAPIAIVVIMLGPVLAGLAGAAAPAFRLTPGIGGAGLSLEYWRMLFEQPGLLRSSLLSLSAGLVSAALSYSAVLLFLAGANYFGWLRRILIGSISPLLAVPHAAAALGLAFLISPSGWLFRLFSPWATGWSRPPDLLILNDPYGLTMIAGLVMKEIPFLLLIALAALPQLDADRRVRAARSLGYAPATAWLKAVAPNLYPLMRLPIYAVIAYAASNVEVALILGPTQPPPLAVQIIRWMNDPDLTHRMLASAAAILQLGVVVIAIGVWRLGEIGAWRFTCWWTEQGARRMADPILAGLGFGVIGLSAAALFIGLAGLLVASFSGYWRFPASLPASWTGVHWLRASDDLLAKLQTTASIALISASISLALVIAALEGESRDTLRKTPSPWLTLLYAPLIAPQVSFLFGLTIGAEALGLPPSLGLVAAAHVIFVLPYVYLSLAAAYRRFDPRWIRAARSLGASPARAFWRIRAPMLLAPGLTALAVGAAVSIGLYLPTQLLGAGRVSTVTTEAVALAAGGDRRLIGVWAIAQAFLPALGFWAALAAPRIVWRNRRNMRAQMSEDT